ncbi:MAG TPA: GNAT family N-acetyltransferase [Candidatus Limnocylindria bacterium]
MTELPAGFTERPVRPDEDLAAVVELANAAAIDEYGVPDVDERLMREAYEIPSFKVERDSLLVLDPAGNAAAVGEYYDTEQEHVAPFFFVRVRPDVLDSGVPDRVLAWGAERAHQNVPLAEPGTRVAMHAGVASVNEGMIAALERNGWLLERLSLTMEIDLHDREVPEPMWPEGITVRTADLQRDARAIHATEIDAFSDHYGFLASSFEDWWHFRTRFFVPEPDLWFLAMDGEEIAGMALCSSRRIGQPDLGWISTLGVRRSWRRRGLGLAILQHCFRELQKRGKPRAGLGVDAQSLTGATRLYERAGMRVVRESREYELLIRDGRDLRTLALA